jgi:putative sterol carrier protein
MAADAPIDPATFLREQVAPRVRRRLDDLRAQTQRLEAEIADRLAAEATMELVLDGERWFLNLRGGEMQVADAPAAPPLVRVVQSRADWEHLARERTPGSSFGVDLTATRIARLRGLQGGLEFRLLTDDGERAVQVHFGPAEPAPPRCTLRMKADDARRLQAGELAPQAAFLQGLVKLEGDVAFAMQVGAALLL